MRNLVFFLFFLNISSTFAFEVELDCETKSHIAFEENMSKAKEVLSRELEYCFNFPYGEKFEECQFHANQAFKNEKEKYQEILKQNLRFCRKFPNF